MQKRNPCSGDLDNKWKGYPLVEPGSEPAEMPGCGFSHKKRNPFFRYHDNRG